MSSPLGAKRPVGVVAEDEPARKKPEASAPTTPLTSATTTSTSSASGDSASPVPGISLRDERVPPYPANPAKTYPFELDTFQKDSISWLETGDSVLVSAHTSAGKTAVAEYAIAMCLRDSKRVIYTSPLKALSNQKYRDLSNDFDNMGLMTGDVTINPKADCLVMTTEILRSMLYRGNEMLREVGCVIFDEIHYMRDKHRGVVWEETIILLPDAVQYVFLSATIPNAQEFADWIAHIHPGQKCHVVYTDFRPTPLQHFIYPAGADGIYCVVDQERKFKEENFKRAMSVLSSGPTSGGGPLPEAGAADGKKMPAKKQSQSRTNIFKLIKMVMDRSLAPCIVFSFSKRECESLALQLSKLDLNDDEEKKLVVEVFTNAIDALSEEDKKLPQVEHIQPLLKRGIGIHHSGLLPILKEVIEILFQEGLVKVLFSTETFSMGLNMPARTVIFTQARKYDGDTTRWLTSGEYIQMSGRAGRRGLDSFGISILMIDEAMEVDVLKQMTSGQPDPLISAFHLGFNMILNLLRVEEVDPEYLMSRSFYQFQVEKQKPALEKELKELEDQKALIKVEHEEPIGEYYSIRHQLEKLREEIRQVVVKPENILSFLQPGRLLSVKDGDLDYDWCICLNFRKLQDPAAGSLGHNITEQHTEKFVLDVLCYCFSDASTGPGVPPNSKDRYKDGVPKPCPSLNDSGEMRVLTFDIDCIQSVSKLRVQVPQDLREKDVRNAMRSTLAKAQAHFGKEGLPLMDPVEEMKITDPNFVKAVKQAEKLEDRMKRNPMHGNTSPEWLSAYARYEKKMELANAMEEIKKQIKDATKTVLRDELKARLRILRRLEYTNEENVIQIKGRVACVLSTADELLMTELIFSGIFNDLTPEQIAGLLSCVVNSERADSDYVPKEEFKKPLHVLYDIVKRITKVSIESKLAVDEEKELAKVSPSLLDATYLWAKGARFSEVCAMTDIFEGSVIRMMRRLEELLRQLAGCARAVGDEALSQKFLESISKIKRDIVFAASLYL
eukprot:RCo011986